MAGPDERAVAPGTFGLRILGVSEVTRAVRMAVRSDPRLVDLWVEGEVGRVTVSTAGHAYFNLRDERNQLQCVWFRDDRLRSAFEAQAGLRIVVHGRIDLYEPTGALQLYVDSIQPAGFGDLAIRFEALKAKLTEEGLFDPARKRVLPSRPATIAVVTSPTGAVWRDICTVLARRWPLVRVVLVAAQVQGVEAPASIVAGLRRVEAWRSRLASEGRAADAPVLTIVARGGGSMEDLWAFNDERVVRAVVAHPIPVVSGIGHEVDVTLTDFAADVRAATPSAAAELVVPDRAEFAASIRSGGRRLDTAISQRVGAAAREVVAERRVLDRLHPAAQLAAARERTGLLIDRATRTVLGRLGEDHRTVERLGIRARSTLPARLADDRRSIERLRTRLGPTLPTRLAHDRQSVERLGARIRPTLPDRLARERARLRATPPLAVLAGRRVAGARASLDSAGVALAVLGPQATLDRGYAIVRVADTGTIVREPAQAPAGTGLRLRVAGGELPATVDGSET